MFKRRFPADNVSTRTGCLQETSVNVSELFSATVLAGTGGGIFT